MDLPRQLDEDRNLLLMRKLYSWALDDDLKYFEYVKGLKDYDLAEDDDVL